MESWILAVLTRRNLTLDLLDLLVAGVRPLSPKINVGERDRKYFFGTRPATTSSNIEFGGSGGRLHVFV